MPVLEIHLEGDGLWPELASKREQIIHLTNEARISIAALPKGMSSGKTSVTMRFDLPDGRIVLAETSFALLRTAVLAIQAKYGE
jgi:hypothetical protein